ncbi:unnamed protein product [Calypogeia fissa]
MPPLRKKGRGGGGGKTEAPLPGEIAGTSPSVSASLVRKEKEKRAGSTAATTTTSSQGVENLGVFVTRSFQKERSEKKLLEASRTSLSLTSGSFQRSLRSRKDNASSTDSTPRVVGDALARRDEREKRLSSSNPAGYRSSSASRATREEPAVCRSSCRELGEEKILYRRSLRAGSSERRVAPGRRDEKSAEYSTRYSTIYPSIASSSGLGKGARDSPSIDRISVKSGISQRLDRAGGDADLSSHPPKASPMSPALLRKSPRLAAAAAAIIPETVNVNPTKSAATSPVISLPVKSSCKCGAFRTSSDNSPGLVGLKIGRGQSPFKNGDTRERRSSRELVEGNSQGTPTPRSSGHNNSSGSKSNTPTFLQGRLALLEGRVTQIAAELKATKDLLDANNPACSKAVLTDIQLKISGIEKAINYRLARECGLMDQLEAEQLKGAYIQAGDDFPVRQLMPSDVQRKSPSAKVMKPPTSSSGEIVPHGQGMFGKAYKAEQKSRALTRSSGPASHDRSRSMTPSQHFANMASLVAPSSRTSRELQPALSQYLDQSLYAAQEIGGSAPSSQVKPVFDYDEFEERLFPHQKLLRSRPSVHQKLMDNRAALHQKLMENSVLLRNKLAALEQRDGVNCGGAFDDSDGAAEFITSLKQQHSFKGSRLERDSERAKPFKSDSRSARRSPMQHISSVGEIDIGDSIAYSGLNGHFEFDGGDPVPNILTRERRTSREGRRSSGSRKSFSGVSSEIKGENLPFHPLEKVLASGSRHERRRRSSEKRKSISTSPEPIQSANKIVMLEPAGKSVSCSPREAPITAAPAPKEAVEVELECTETFGDENLTVEEGYAKEFWMPETRKNDGITKIVSAPGQIPEQTSAAINLACDETLSSDDPTDDIVDYPLKPNLEAEDQPYLGECEDNDLPRERLHQIGSKIATAGWFISEGEGILLAHDDGYCSFYDVANREGKATFKGPPNALSRPWGDCWFVRAAGPDGILNKYVVAATVGSGVDSAFCSWDFYDRKITAFRSESSLVASPSSVSFKSAGSSSPERRHFVSKDGTKSGCFSWYSGSDNAQLLKGRTPSGPLSLDLASGGSCLSESDNLDIRKWWYRPCSPLLASAASGLKTITLYDVRDGDVVMSWDLFKWTANMEYSSPIQWRNKGKIVVAEDEAISLWDVNSMTPQRLHNVDLSGKELRALYVGNSDADFSVGIRQRASSRDSVSGDGILCTQDAVNVLDFRVPAGIVLKIPTFGETANSVYANGDSVFAGVTDFNRVAGSIQSKVNEWSIKQGRPMSMYKLPDSTAHRTVQSVAQVWGNSDTVVAVNGNGLFMFDSLKGVLPRRDGAQSAKEVLGTDDLVRPSFDFSENRVLLISQDRSASWCDWP